MKKTILSIAIFCCFVSMMEAQIPDSVVQSSPLISTEVDSSIIVNNLVTDTTSVIADSTKKKQKFNPIHWVRADYPSPKKALILSAVPGMGQFYNKKYWKIPIVYAAIGGLVYVVDLNNRQYNRLQTAYLATVDDDPDTISEFVDTRLDNDQTLRNLRDSYDKNRQLSWFGLVAVYILGGVDAFVDGHLLDFDVSDDLSMKVKPNIDVNWIAATPTLGIGISFQAQKKRRR